jgi:hypothetical protein
VKTATSGRSRLALLAALVMAGTARYEARQANWFDWRYAGRFWKETFRDIVADPWSSRSGTKSPGAPRPQPPRAERGSLGVPGGWSGGEDVQALALGLQPLHFAALKGDPAEVERLLAAGAQVNARDAHGWAALHWAASCGEVNPAFGGLSGPVNPPQPGGPPFGTPPIPPELLRSGLPRPEQSADHLAVVHALLRHGADAGARTRDGKTPLDLATEGQHLEIAQALREHAAAGDRH